MFTILNVPILIEIKTADFVEYFDSCTLRIMLQHGQKQHFKDLILQDKYDNFVSIVCDRNEEKQNATRCGSVVNATVNHLVYTSNTPKKGS